ncbi:MAG: thioredoxin domain-containing protein [Hyphomicrobiaceae bacterium]|nr:thioredoxin domain-containing protein [Hyphomicrobiaceae bacterium]
MPFSLDKLMAGLTSPKGAALAAPLVIGTGLLFAIAGNAGQPQPDKAGKTGTPVQTAAAPSAVQPAPQGGSVVTPVSGKFTPEQEKAIGKIVHDYLIANPEVLVAVSKELERRQKEHKAKEQLRLITQEKKEIFHSPLDYVMGNKEAKITIVEYFDYNCGWCKRAFNEVAKLAKEDTNVRIVFKEFPIFGEHSQFAARAAMASREQGKYWDFHVAMMKARRVTKDNVLQIAQRVGLDVEKLKKDMENAKYAAALHRNATIAQTLGIEGTPGFIIDDRINPGFLPLAALKQIVADIRAKGCKVC